MSNFVYPHLEKTGVDLIDDGFKTIDGKYLTRFVERQCSKRTTSSRSYGTNRSVQLRFVESINIFVINLQVSPACEICTTLKNSYALTPL